MENGYLQLGSVCHFSVGNCTFAHDYGCMHSGMPPGYIHFRRSRDAPTRTPRVKRDRPTAGKPLSKSCTYLTGLDGPTGTGDSVTEVTPSGLTVCARDFKDHWQCKDGTSRSGHSARATMAGVWHVIETASSGAFRHPTDLIMARQNPCPCCGYNRMLNCARSLR